MSHSLRIARAPAGAARRGLASLLFVAALAWPAAAGDKPPFEARAGLDVAAAAAHAWAPDAYLVYVENDEDLDVRGAAVRWGYLFYAPSLDASRGYSVRDGRIVVAETLPARLEAPPLASDWIDSGAALAIAEKKAGLEFRSDQGGTLATMLLMRGAFHGGDPDETTWTLVYTAPDQPSLFVVVDAAAGKVRRTWRG